MDWQKQAAKVYNSEDNLPIYDYIWNKISSNVTVRFGKESIRETTIVEAGQKADILAKNNKHNRREERIHFLTNDGGRISYNVFDQRGDKLLKNDIFYSSEGEALKDIDGLIAFNPCNNIKKKRIGLF
jgi:hypothetical protein